MVYLQSLVLFLAASVGCWCEVNAFASKLLSDCTLPLQEGFLMMGQPIVNSEELSIVVEKNGVVAANGEMFGIGDTLKVSLVPATRHMVLEVLGGATFAGLSCRGSRSKTNGETLIISEEPQDIEISAVWARSFAQGVQLVPPFHLKYEGSISCSSNNVRVCEST